MPVNSATTAGHVKTLGADLVHEGRYVANDSLFAVGNLRCALQLADVLDDKVVALRVAQRLAEHAMRVADRSGR
jgi:hypothetical protein